MYFDNICFGVVSPPSQLLLPITTASDPICRVGAGRERNRGSSDYQEPEKRATNPVPIHAIRLLTIMGWGSKSADHSGPFFKIFLQP
jgi:hypothetical protein